MTRFPDSGNLYFWRLAKSDGYVHVYYENDAHYISGKNPKTGEELDRIRISAWLAWIIVRLLTRFIGKSQRSRHGLQ